MIELFQNGAFQASEQFLRFTGARHHLIADNIANISTPHYRPVDMDPRAFQEKLQAAIDRRRSSDAVLAGPLEEYVPLDYGQADTSGMPGVWAMGENILFHDRNDRDLDRMMQQLAENTMAHQTAVELLRNQMDLLNTAIRERL